MTFRQLFLFATFILFFFNTTYSQIRQTNIEKIISTITTDSYRIHFDSIQAYKGAFRKVLPEQEQPEDHNKCRDYIQRSLSRSLDPENVYLHHFEVEYHGGLANVIGYKKGTKPSKGIWIIGAHYDSNNDREKHTTGKGKASPGANDNGTGIAAILEIARVVAPLETEESVLFCAWDMEEKYTDSMPTGSNHWFLEFVKKLGRTDWDLIGNGAFIKKKDIVANLNFDMFGNPQDTENGIPVLWVFNGNNMHANFVDDYVSTMNTYADSVYAINSGRIILSDHYTFGHRRIPALENLESGYPDDPYYHTYSDCVENENNIDFKFASEVTKGGFAFLLENILESNTEKDIEVNISDKADHYTIEFSEKFDTIEVIDITGESQQLFAIEDHIFLYPTKTGLYNILLWAGNYSQVLQCKLNKKESLTKPSLSTDNL